MKKGASRKAATKSTKAVKKGAKKPAVKAAAKKPAAKQAAPKKGAPKKSAAKASAPKKAALKKAAPRKAAANKAPKVAAPKAPKIADGTPLDGHAGKAMIIQILGDAEAYFIDFARLSDAQRRELLEHHLAAWDARKRAEGQPGWFETFVPVALIGESMPPVVRGRFDLSAPHEGVVLFHKPTGALLHASSKDDDQLAVMAPDIEAISPTESYVDEVFDPSEQSFAYSVDRTQSQGFTRSEIVTMMQAGGAELILV
jgi:hypothetical protein